MNMLRPNWEQEGVLTSGTNRSGNGQKRTVRTHARARLINQSSSLKLLRMLPCVLFVKTRKPEMDMHRHATTDSVVETCVTWAKRSRVGCFSEP